MTVAVETAETTFSLSGSALGPFATGWTCAEASDLAVWLNTGSGPAQLASDLYTVAGADPLTGGLEVTLASSNLPGGGSWAAGSAVTLQRITTVDQPFSFGAGLEPAQVEAAFDRLSRQVQELAQALARTLRTNPGDYPGTLPPSSARAGNALAFNSSGNPIP